MIVLEETIEVARPVEHCFRYVSDFRTTPEWDPTVLEADKMTDGGIDVGTRFALRCKAGPVTVSLEYVIEELTPSSVLCCRERVVSLTCAILLPSRIWATGHAYHLYRPI